MTVYDDTLGYLSRARSEIDAAETSATGDPSLVPVLKDPLANAVNAIVAAQDDLESYVAALPLPLVKGLSNENMSQYPPSVMNEICEFNWADLQKTKGGPIEQNNVVDQWLAKGKPGRVRPMFGIGAPTWARDLAGVVTVVNAQDGTSASVAKWWESVYQAVQADFLAKFAAKYDGLISLIFLTTPMTKYAEPMQRGVGSPVTCKNLLAAGYTIAKDKASFTAALAAYDVFKKSRVGVALTPIQEVTAAGLPSSDVAWTNSFIDSFIARYGARAVLQNNSIRYPISGAGANYGVMYDHMKASGAPQSFQTATEARVGDYAKTIEWAIAQGAHLVELSPGYRNHLTDLQLQQYDSQLRAAA